jgi:hypothetical protein
MDARGVTFATKGGGVKLIAAVALTPANRPEGEAAAELFADVERQGLDVQTLDIDRAYLMAPTPGRGL